MVNDRRPKLFDFKIKVMRFQGELKNLMGPLYCHDTTTVEVCLLNLRLKSVGSCSFLVQIHINCQSEFTFVISVYILPPIPYFNKIGK